MTRTGKQKWPDVKKVEKDKDEMQVDEPTNEEEEGAHA